MIIAYSKVLRTVLVPAFIISLLNQSTSAALIARFPEPPLQTEEILVPDGLELEVVTTEDISSKTVPNGTSVTLRLVHDVLISNFVVLAKGTLVRGTVSAPEKNGKDDGVKFGIRVDSTITVDGQIIKLRSSNSKTADDRAGTAVVLGAIVGVFGFLKKEKDAKIKKGTKARVFTDEVKRVRITGTMI